MDTIFLVIGFFFSLMALPGKLVHGTGSNASVEDKRPSYRVATVLNKPWMMQTQNGYEGILVDLLDEVAKLVNFTYIIKEPPNKVYGRTKYMAGEIQVNGIIGEIISGEADLGVADLIISDVRSNVVSFTRPFATTGAQILLRKPDNNLRCLGTILLPFSLSLWICTVVALLVTTAVIYVTERFGHYGHHRDVVTIPIQQGILESLQFILSVFLFRGRRDLRVSVPSRIMLVCWWAFCLIMIIAYTASLTGYLLSASASKPHIPFKTFEEMAGQSDVHYGGWFEMTLNVNDNIQRSMNRHISSKYTYYSNIDEAAKRVLNTETPFAAIVEGYNGQKAVNEHCELMLLQERLFEIDYGIACPRDHIGEGICSDISMAIRRLREDGALYTIMNKWWGSARTCEKVSESDFITSTRTGIYNLNFKALGISDMFVAFVLHLTGIALSVVTTIIGRKYIKKKPVDLGTEDELDRVAESNDNRKQGTANSVPEPTTADAYIGANDGYPDIDA